MFVVSCSIACNVTCTTMLIFTKQNERETHKYKPRSKKRISSSSRTKRTTTSTTAIKRRARIKNLSQANKQFLKQLGFKLKK